MKFSGERLKERRKTVSLTLDALAQKCSSSKSYIWELENNKDIKPSGDKVYLLSLALGVPMEYFFNGTRWYTPYGYCPHCGGEGITRERRINGNDTCIKGHIYPSSAAIKKD